MYGLEVVQPLYVFCGVACITGGIIGLTGRWVSRVLVRWAGIEVEAEGAKKVKTEGYEEEDDLREDADEEYEEAAERMRQEKERAKERAWIRRRSSSDVKGKGRDKNREKESYSVKKEY
ncbi:hypothetical protein BJ165DRAFT_1494914 [Panaeolus papilionaceus]|nr:hypothetical protein BJ165DRAFT_1494914 [Panaeolus papilionaceus]